jgi:Tfp pilus assembly protein PilO
MKELATTVILIVGAIGLFFTYTKPNYAGVTALTTEIASYDKALNEAREFEALKNDLLEEYNTFNPDELARLERLIPLNVDNVRLIIEIDSVAATHGLTVSDIAFEGETDEEGAEGEEASGDTALPLRDQAREYQSVLMTFSVDASYEDFKSFMSDLEKSLRLVDIQSITTGTSESGLDQYTVTFKTYWLGASS